MKKGETRKEPFIVSYLSTSLDGSGHSIGITADGLAYSWGRSNSFGQLGRAGKSKVPLPITTLGGVKAIRAYTGGTKESGHSAILDTNGYLWLTGCDRWQQLGLGSSNAGAAGYTWKEGRIWQEQFQRNDYLDTILRDRLSSTSEKDNDTCPIRDVALGADHTVVLSSNQRDVYTFGKGGEGQLGLHGKPFVSTPIRSTILSEKDKEIYAVCAIHHCSMTLYLDGTIMKKTGKCNLDYKQALDACIKRKQKDNLINATNNGTKHK